MAVVSQHEPQQAGIATVQPQRGAAMAKHKKQHFVPQCYLKAWCDPTTPVDQDPYVWRFRKDGSDPRRKAPENIFHETDLYTIHRPGGGRDLVLEHGRAHRSRQPIWRCAMTTAPTG